MATFFDSASLVMIPSGYKDDKLYSIKPTDGSGDFTFSRDGAGASPATRVNASGLIEKGRGNVLLQSNTFNAADWLSTNPVVTSGQSGYDGTNDAWLLSKSQPSARIYQNITYSGVNTFSVYAKAGTLNWVMINNGTNSVWYDLQNGVVGSNSAGGGSLDASIEAVGATGWYRVVLVSSVSASLIRIYPSQDDNDVSGTSGNIYIQDAQLEQGLVATDYIETTTAAVSAGLLGDMPRLDYSGGATCPSLLLEPSRVNVLSQSEYFGTTPYSRVNVSVTHNDLLSPEGVVNAAKLVSSGGASRIETFPTLTDNTDYTASIFAKRGDVNFIMISVLKKDNTQDKVFFNLLEGTKGTTSGTPIDSSIEAVGDYYRVSVTIDSSSGGTTPRVQYLIANTDNNVVTASGEYIYVYGAQLEAGSYPTSYIPTYGSASTRGADSYYNNNLASLHDTANGFCLMFDYSEVEEGDSAFQDYFSIQQAFNNDTGFRAEAAGASNSEWRLYTDNITTTLGFPMTLSNIASRRKVLVKIESTGIKIFADGVLITSQSGSVTIPTLGTIQPSRSTTQPALTGIKQSLGLVFFSPILTDAECIALTTI